MSPAERQRKIESYGQAYIELTEALREFPRSMWHVRPAVDQWTIQEIIIHITDSEANSYVRCRRLIAEPGQTLMAYDEMGWAARLDYAGQSAEAALELFQLLRRNTYQLIRTLPEASWSHTGHHPENGPMTLEDWLEVYERHVREHVAQMWAVYTVWQATAAH